MNAGFLSGKRGLIMGVANNRSLGWGIAKACAEQGAKLAFTYQGAALEKRVAPLCQSIQGAGLIGCDVTSDADLDRTFNQIVDMLGGLDFVVHAIAFSDKRELDGAYVNTSRANFAQTMDISCYSLTAIAQRARTIMPEGGSLLTLSYLGANRVMPHYNVMGVAKAALEASVRYLAVDLGSQGLRVNALSSGPVKTLAAQGIADFRHILRWNELNAPLKRNVHLDQVGSSGAYLVSDLAGGVTGEVHHVDCGYHVVGMVAVDRAGEVADLLNQVGGNR